MGCKGSRVRIPPPRPQFSRACSECAASPCPLLASPWPFLRQQPESTRVRRGRPGEADAGAALFRDREVVDIDVGGLQRPLEHRACAKERGDTQACRPDHGDSRAADDPFQVFVAQFLWRGRLGAPQRPNNPYIMSRKQQLAVSG